MEKIRIAQNELETLLDESKWESLGLNTKKGILFMGPVGVGKTTILRKLAQNHSKICWGHPRCPDYNYNGIRVFNAKSLNARSVNQVYEHSGSSGLSVLKSHDMFLDDIGSEQTFVNHYGIKISPVEEILFDRNDNKSIRTFVTTNLNLERLSEVYGDRMADRWNEMFNLVVIEGESYRK